MKLSSDHPQWYDPIFDGEGATFERMAFTRGGLSKRAQLELFDRIGLATPPHGTVRTLAAQSGRSPFGTAPIAAELSCVVYEDELEHRGRGKVLLPLEQALASHPEHYATLFVPPPARAVMVRHVRFGRIGFWLRQETRGDDWRSNIDDAERLLSTTEHPEPPPIPRVLWAIDFLPSVFGLLAIDFNTAPELATLGEAHAVGLDRLLTELQSAPAEHLAQL